MRTQHALIVIVLCAMLGGCALLPTGKKARGNRTFLIAPVLTITAQTAPSCGSIQVASGQAATGFRTAKMAYMRGPYELNYFAFSRWADAPSRMLADQTRRVLRNGGGFEGVLESPVAARTDFHLELADVKVVQIFDGESSMLDVAFEARFFNADRRALIAVQRFQASEPAGEDPQTGVEATNRAAAELLSQVAAFALKHCEAHAN
ncbi:MAG: ABC-type transport auxiliary lipoprotein family protein [Gammaproteobacteria bacterium]